MIFLYFSTKFGQNESLEQTYFYVNLSDFLKIISKFKMVPYKQFYSFKL